MNKPAFNGSVRTTVATLAHTEKYLFPAVLVIYVAHLLGPRAGILDVVCLWGAFAWVATVVASAIHEHDTSLCLPCIEDVPVDAPERAQRRKRILWFLHFSSRRKVQVVALPALFFVPQLLLLALDTQPSRITELVSTPGIVWGFTAVFARSQHRNLRPWCAYCRGWDKDGDHEPSPDPVAFGTKTLH